MGSPVTPRVTTIGSCRVHTPFRLLADDGRITLANRGVYGFTHYAKEAVQQLAIMRGEVRIPWGLAPYVSHRKLPQHMRDGGWVATAINDLTETDVLVVEVSSLKEIAFREYFLQINRVRKNLVRDDPELLRWWVSIYGADVSCDRELLAQRAQSDLEGDLIREIEVAVQSVPSLLADMGAIVAAHNGYTMFVSHFDVESFSGQAIPIRRKLARALEAHADALGTRFFNPRPLIEGFGKRMALVDLAHYTPMFERAVAENLFAVLIADDVVSAPKSWVPPDRTALRKAHRAAAAAAAAAAAG